MPRYPENERGFGWFVGPILMSLAVAIIIVIVWLIIWAIVAIFPDTGAIWPRDTAGFVQFALFPGGVPTPFFWILVTVVAGFFLVSFAFEREGGALGVLAVVVTVVLVLGSVGFAIFKGVTYDELGSDRYLSTTTLKVKDTAKLPDILSKYAANGTLKLRVEQGDLPTQWTPRVASATGALKVMKKTGDAVNNTQLMDGTATYLYGDGMSGKWTAIRNGINQQSIYGIASWSGTGDKVTTCRFTGDNSLNKTFGGQFGKNLWNSVAGAYPSFYYDEDDMWGYCDGSDPVIVIPGVSLDHVGTRSVDTAAGVVTIRGSVGGNPVLSLRTQVKPGDFPGPVYPQRLVNSQRNSLDWAAGYWQSINEHFGFDATDVDSQFGNNSNYLMKNEADGRLYWVTPLKPQATDSQTLIAYSIIPADEVSASVLNPQTVYVLNEDDARVVNLDDLLARVKSSVCAADTNFCGKNANGSIVEFLPVSDTVWQVFAEVQGRVKYRIDVNVDARINPSIVNIDSGQSITADSGDKEATPSTGTTADCNSPSGLTDKQLASCLSSLAEELGKRSNK